MKVVCFSLFVFSELLPKMVPLGCFVEKPNRLLDIKFASVVNSYDKTKPFATAIKCAHIARDEDYEYFAVQNFGECRTGLNMADNYDTYGEADSAKCIDGVGSKWTNFVYDLKPSYTTPSRCDNKPCMNGATCVPHFNDPDRYHCQCGDWFNGDHCEGMLFTFSINTRVILQNRAL